jgi:hypothetical protein
LIRGFIKGFEMKRTLVVSLKTEVNGERERESDEARVLYGKKIEEDE